jgi:pimeloyl-ACP methyl ester carboxylesterase
VLFDTALKSDLLFWLAIRGIPGTLTESILGTPMAVVRNAGEADQKRVRELMTHILPVSPRRLGLLNDARVVSTLQRFELERIHAPTLIISAKDDGYGTFPGAQYSASQIAGARFIGFETGGHLCVGRTEEIAREVARLFKDAGLTE